MKIIKKYRNILGYALILAAGIFLGWILFGGTKGQDSGEIKTEEFRAEAPTTWTCSMHPQIQQPEPGDCPICGMELIPLESGSTRENDTQFTLSDQAIKLAGIQTQRVQYVDPETTLRLQGKIQPDEREVKSQAIHFSGRIEKLFVEYEGEKVLKGQTLASVYSPDFISAQKELLEGYKVRKSNPALLQAAKQKMTNWKLSGEQISEILESGRVHETIDIKAEITGYVLDKNVSEGSYVTGGAVLYTIANLDKLWVIFDAYEEELPFIHPGDQVEIRMRSLPGKVFSSEITYIDPLIDAKKRTARVRAEIPNTGGMLKPEMFVTGELTTSPETQEKVLAIPASAVMWTGTRSVVYVAPGNGDSNMFEYKEVTIGQDLGKSYVILEGLQEGEYVVTNGSFTLDAAAQLQNKKSMMNPAPSGKPAGMHNHVEDATEDHTEHTAHKEDTLMVPDKFSRQFNKIQDHYYQLKNALIRADKPAASKKAEAFLQALEGAGRLKTSLEKEHRDHWSHVYATLEEEGQKIQSAPSIDIQRKHFKSFSNAMIQAARTFSTGQEKVYVQFCPMADNDRGAYWLSQENIIANPYYGDMMLRCGEVTETLKK